MSRLKRNVKEFDQDVDSNAGYKYTTNSPFSSIVANERITKSIIGFLYGHKYKTLVDAGCGDGVYSHELKNTFPEISIEAFDPAAKAIKLAQKKYPSIKFYVGNILDIKSLPNKTFDVAVIRGVLHHLPNQELALKNAFQIAREVIIMEPNGNNPILKLIERTSRYHIIHEEQSFSIGKFRQFFKNAGGEIKHLEYVGFVPFFFPTFFAKILFMMQPVLEKIPMVNKYFSAQIMIKARRKKGRR